VDRIDIAETIAIELNGAPHQVPRAHTLLDLVTALALSNQALALAVNRSVVRRQDWPKQVLVVGDQVDIVRAIGGG
jgi:sulfur carrier protein